MALRFQGERVNSNLSDIRERLFLHYTVLPYSMPSRIYPKGSVVVSEDVLGYGGINGGINGEISFLRLSGAFWRFSPARVSDTGKELTHMRICVCMYVRVRYVCAHVFIICMYVCALGVEKKYFRIRDTLFA